MSHLYGGDWVPKILLERGSNPEKGGGVDEEMEGLQLFYYLAIQLHFVCVRVCVCVWEQSFLYYSLDLHSLELTIQDSHPNLYDIKTFYHLYISDISDPF